MSSKFNPPSLVHAVQARDPLQEYHKKPVSLLFLFIAALTAVFLIWAAVFEIDEVVRARGEIVASSHIQTVQAIDGGVLKSLLVNEGDRVQKGDVIARLDPLRFEASAEEVSAHLAALRIRERRLLAEIAGTSLEYGKEWDEYPLQRAAEMGVYRQRLQSLRSDLSTIESERSLARREVALLEPLVKSGDAPLSDLLRARRQLRKIEGELASRKNKYLLEAQKDLADTRAEIIRRKQELRARESAVESSVIRAPVTGVIKKVSVTTVGAVLKPGDELLQMIGLDDDLVLEAKVSPADIALVKPGLKAMMRLDPYDFTIYGGVESEVKYVSADTLKEDTPHGREIYYRVRVAPPSRIPLTAVGKKIELLPGMTGSVDIRTGKRTLLSYLLKPIKKTISESFGER